MVSPINFPLDVATTRLDAAFLTVQELLQGFVQNQFVQNQFVQHQGFRVQTLAPAFGDSPDHRALAQLGRQFERGDFGALPKLEVRLREELRGARGAYDARNDRIFLAQDFLAQAPEAEIVAVVLEEIGHAIDARINWRDSRGDEGAIFAALVLGRELGPGELESLRGEDDRTTLVIDGELVAVEQASFMVTNTNDSGAGSLRQAILAANGASGADVITFSAGLAGQTIGLTSGQLSITDALTITGLGVDQLTIDGQGSGRIFEINDGNNSHTIQVSLTGLTLTGGDLVSNGGAIYNRESLDIANSTITGNTSLGRGGGIYNYKGTLNITNSTISNNSTFRGGGLFTRSGILFFTNSTVSNNSADASGGGIYSHTYQYSPISGFSSTITNSTISGNSAISGGGFINFNGGLAVQNSTITANTALAGNGSGIASFADAATHTLVTSSIVSGNLNSDVDLIGGVTSSLISGNNNLIGNGNAIGDFNLSGDTTNNSDPQLGPLTDNGGLTHTHEVLAGSPAIDAGSNLNSLTTDQRGSGFNRVRAGIIDIGAVELQDQAPAITVAGVTVNENQTTVTTASATDPDSVDGDAAPSFSLSGTDAAQFNIDSSTGVITFKTAPDFETPADSGGGNDYDLIVSAIDGNNATLTDSQAIVVVLDDVDEAPALTVSSVTVNESQTAVTTAMATDPDAGDAAPVFKLSGPDAAFFNIDAATGVITFATAPEFDTPFGGNTDNIYDLTVIVEDGNNASLSTSQAITVTVNPLDLVVDTPVDELDGSVLDGDISLRDAIAAIADGGTIKFSNGLLNSTIFLGLGQVVINKPLTIDAEDKNIMIDAQNGSRVLYISDLAPGFLEVTLSGLTITNGNASSRGGGIRNDESLTLINSTVQGNTTTTSGGGLAAIGPVTVVNSTITGNLAPRGGGLYTYSSSSLINTTVSNNSTSTGLGGGIANRNGILTLSHSTITDNTASGGGGLYSYSGGAINLTNSLVAGNTAINTLGGHEINVNAGTITANNNNLLGHGGETNSEAFQGGFVPGVNDINATSDGTNVAWGNILNPTLANNGGATQTHTLAAGSPAIDAGNNSANFNLVEANLGLDLNNDGDTTDTLTQVSEIAFDQRGNGFDRVRAGTIDIGAVEVQDQAPVLSVMNVTVSEGQTTVTTATATDPDSIDGDLAPTFALSGTDAARFDIDNVTGAITFKTAPNFAAPTDNGGDNIYDLVVTAIDGDNAALTHNQGITITVAPLNLVVDTAVDEADGSISDGDISLRDAIAALGSGGTITFANSLLNDTIALGATELLIDKALTIDGGNHNLTIDAQNLSRVFHITDSDAGTFLPVSISGLTVTRGNATGNFGGGIRNFESLTVNNSTIQGNTAFYGGGIDNRFGILTLTNSTLTGNSAVSGGGIDTRNHATILNSTISGNTASNSSAGGASPMQGLWY
jgi:hypothetical protein